MKKLWIVIVLVLAGWLGRTAAQIPTVIWSDKTGWYKIGEKIVDMKVEKEEILVMGADKFSALKFKVKEAPVEILNMEAVFEAGDKQKFEVNSPLQAGTETRIFELAGGSRELKKISFSYKTLPNELYTKAHIEIWGYKMAEKERIKQAIPEM